MMNGGRLSGAVAVVTGASAGIGEAIAKTFAREGARVAIVARTPGETHRVAAEIEAAGGVALAVPAGVTQAADVNAMVEAVLKRWAGIDILVNGVGGWVKLAPVTDIAEEEWDRVITLNLKSAFLCIRAVARVMIERGRGRIINIGSQSGSAPNLQADSSLPYAASKGVLLVLTRHLARQLGPHGVTVNAVSPGTTLTERVKKVWDAATVAKKAAANPLRCLVEPQDTADAVLFLASDERRHVTGVNLNVNAGVQ
jgi:3-oxoacyl-[acyl-carrier protein] reductase